MVGSQLASPRQSVSLNSDDESKSEYDDDELASSGEYVSAIIPPGELLEHLEGLKRRINVALGGAFNILETTTCSKIGEKPANKAQNPSVSGGVEAGCLQEGYFDPSSPPSPSSELQGDVHADQLQSLLLPENILAFLNAPRAFRKDAASYISSICLTVSYPSSFSTVEGLKNPSNPNVMMASAFMDQLKIFLQKNPHKVSQENGGAIEIRDASEDPLAAIEIKKLNSPYVSKSPSDFDVLFGKAARSFEITIDVSAYSLDKNSAREFANEHLKGAIEAARQTPKIQAMLESARDAEWERV